jgi:GNAT superfamily N-acetyltransferase
VELSIFGHPVKVGMIGAVAADPEFRGQGMATRTLHEVFDHHRRGGGQLLMISGGRGLYLRNGARQVGRFLQYRLNLKGRRAGEVDVEKVGPEGAPVLSLLHRRKAVRFLRSLEEWQLNVAGGRCQGCPSTYWVVRRGGEPTAYFCMPNRPETKEGLCELREWGGRPLDVIAALPKVARLRGCTCLRWRLYPHEVEARLGLLAAGAHDEGPALMQGTGRVADFVALMNALRGYMAELLGEERAAELEFREPGKETFSIHAGDEKLSIPDYATLTDLLFGKALEALPAPMPDGKLKEALSALLPFPIAQYDMTYS